MSEVIEEMDATLSEATQGTEAVQAEVVAGPYAQIAAKYKAGEELSDEEMDAIVDVAIDQGGCIETCDHTTSHDEPTFERYGVNHYSVANMPGAVPRTSTIALSNATLPYILKLANKGLEALKEDDGFMKGLNTYDGHYTYKAVAEALNGEYTDPFDLI